MQPTKEQINQFYLTDLVNTETVRAITRTIQSKYPDCTDDYPDEYWAELNSAIQFLLVGALQSSVPHHG